MGTMMLNVAAMLTGSPMRAFDTWRFPGDPVLHRENIGEHMWLNALYCYLIARELETHGIEVDMGVVLSRAILHDMEETITGDLARGVKYWGDGAIKANMDALGTHAMMNLSKELRNIQIPMDWESAKDLTLEGRIVAVADFMCVSAFLIREVRLGNNIMLAGLKQNLAWTEELVDQMEASAVEPWLVRIADEAAKILHIEITMRRNA